MGGIYISTYGCTEAELDRAWVRGSNDGDGHSVGEKTDTPMQAAQREGYMDVFTIDPDGSVVGTDARGRTVVICDAHGPWGVVVGTSHYVVVRGDTILGGGHTRQEALEDAYCHLADGPYTVHAITAAEAAAVEDSLTWPIVVSEAQ